MAKKKVIILGGGAGGLSAAWFISGCSGYSVSIYEKTASLGGVSGSFRHNGFNLDYGPHKIYSVLPGVMSLLEESCAGNLIRVKKRHNIILKGRLIDYPVRFGALPKIFGFWGMLQCGLSVLPVLMGSFCKNKAHSYKDYIISRFGYKLYSYVFEPIAQKTWESPETLSADVAKTRIPSQGLLELIMRTIGVVKESKETQAEYFLYPKEGFSGIINCMAGKIKDNGGVFHMEKYPVKLNISQMRVESVVFNDGEEVDADLVISSVPLNDLSKLLFEQDDLFHKDVESLEMLNFVLVYIFVNRPRVLDVQWIFCPDKDLVFNRISEQKLMSEEVAPLDKTVICCDFTCREGNWKWGASSDSLADRCIADLEKLKILQRSQVYDYVVVKVPRFYPRYSIGYQETTAKVFKKIKSIENIICTGRLGLYNYNNFDHCVEMGQVIAKGLSLNKPCSDIMDQLIAHSATYRIVD